MLEFKPTGGEEIYYTAYENGAALGICRVRVSGQYAYITELKFDKSKPYIMEGLVKSALNAAAKEFAYIAVCSAEIVADFALPHGFKREGDNFNGEIPEILMGRCHKFGNL